MALSREDLLNAGDVPFARKATFPDDYPAPFGGADFYVRVMTAGERARFESQFVKKTGQPDRVRAMQMRERLAIATFCDESGKLLLSEADLPLLSAKDGRVIGYITEAAAAANKVDETDLETLAKN